METLDEARYKVEPEPYGDFVATPAGVRASLDDPERKENPARLSVTYPSVFDCTLNIVTVTITATVWY